jgi:hypothetical protein
MSIPPPEMIVTEIDSPLSGDAKRSAAGPP